MFGLFASALVVASSASLIEEERAFSLRLNSAIQFDAYRKCLITNARKVSPFGTATSDDAINGARRDCASSRETFRSGLYQGVRTTAERERYVKLLLANADGEAKAVLENEWRVTCRFKEDRCHVRP